MGEQAATLNRHASTIWNYTIFVSLDIRIHVLIEKDSDVKIWPPGMIRMAYGIARKERRILIPYGSLAVFDEHCNLSLLGLLTLKRKLCTISKSKI